MALHIISAYCLLSVCISTIIIEKVYCMCPFPNQDPSAPIQLVRTSKGQILYRPNAPIRFQQIAPGSVADYSCNPINNIMLGDKIRTCFFNGTWSGRTPRCAPSWCRAPVSQGRTQFQVINTNNNINTNFENQWPFGTNAKHICQSPNNNQVQRNVSRECQANGEWSGQEPVCITATNRPNNVFTSPRPPVKQGNSRSDDTNAIIIGSVSALVGVSLIAFAFFQYCKRRNSEPSSNLVEEDTSFFTVHELPSPPAHPTLPKTNLSAQHQDPNKHYENIIPIPGNQELNYIQVETAKPSAPPLDLLPSESSRKLHNKKSSSVVYANITSL